MPAAIEWHAYEDPAVVQARRHAVGCAVAILRNVVRFPCPRMAPLLK